MKDAGKEIGGDLVGDILVGGTIQAAMSGISRFRARKSQGIITEALRSLFAGERDILKVMDFVTEPSRLRHFDDFVLENLLYYRQPEEVTGDARGVATTVAELLLFLAAKKRRSAKEVTRRYRFVRAAEKLVSELEVLEREDAKEQAQMWRELAAGLA